MTHLVSFTLDSTREKSSSTTTAIEKGKEILIRPNFDVNRALEEKIRQVVSIIQIPYDNVMMNLNQIERWVYAIKARKDKKNKRLRKAQKTSSKSISTKSSYIDSDESRNKVRGEMPAIRDWLNERALEFNRNEQDINDKLGGNRCKLIALVTLLLNEIPSASIISLVEFIYRLCDPIKCTREQFLAIASWIKPGIKYYLQSEPLFPVDLKAGAPYLIFSKGHVEVSNSYMPLCANLGSAFSIKAFPPYIYKGHYSFLSYYLSLKRRGCHPTKPYALALDYLPPSFQLGNVTPNQLGWLEQMQQQNQDALDDYCSAISITPVLLEMINAPNLLSHYKSLSSLPEMWKSIRSQLKPARPQAFELLDSMFQETELNYAPSPKEFHKLLYYLGVPCEFYYLVALPQGDQILRETAGCMNNWNFLISKGHIEMITPTTPLGMPLSINDLTEYSPSLQKVLLNA